MMQPPKARSKPAKKIFSYLEAVRLLPKLYCTDRDVVTETSEIASFKKISTAKKE